MMRSYKDELRQIDHDCEGVDCPVCGEIIEMTEAEAKEKLEWVRKHELEHKEAE